MFLYGPMTDNTVFSNFFPSAAYTQKLDTYPVRASDSTLTSIPYFVIFAGLYVLIDSVPLHRIKHSSRNNC